MHSIIKKLICCQLALLETFVLLGQSSRKYIATVGGMNNDSIARGSFILQQGVAGGWWSRVDHTEHVTIDSFRVIVFRSDSLIINNKNIGNFFGDSLKAKFRKVEVNDRVLFFDIYARSPEKKSVLIPSFQLIIK